jgi:hypothetical protein
MPLSENADLVPGNTAGRRRHKKDERALETRIIK